MERFPNHFDEYDRIVESLSVGLADAPDLIVAVSLRIERIGPSIRFLFSARSFAPVVVFSGEPGLQRFFESASAIRLMLSPMRLSSSDSLMNVMIVVVLDFERLR